MHFGKSTAAIHRPQTLLAVPARRLPPPQPCPSRLLPNRKPAQRPAPPFTFQLHLRPAPMSHPILAVEDVSKTYDGFKAISNLTFYLEEGELRTVIGPNGAGKSTFFDLISGRAKPDK